MIIRVENILENGNVRIDVKCENVLEKELSREELQRIVDVYSDLTQAAMGRLVGFTSDHETTIVTK